MHHGLSGVHQCTMGNQEETSAPWESKWYVARFVFHSWKILKIPSKSRLNLQNLEANLQILLILFDCTTGKTVNLPSIFLYFLAISGTYLRLGRSKWHTLKAKKHLLDVANAGKGPTQSGGSGMHQEGSLFWRNFVWAGNFLGRSYCLQVANMLMFPLTANLPINR